MLNKSILKKSKGYFSSSFTKNTKPTGYKPQPETDLYVTLPTILVTI